MNERDFFKAVKAGDAAGVCELLKKQPSLVKVVDKDQSTGLHHAAWKGHASIVELLIAGGADLNAHNANEHWGTTPLHAAAHGDQRAAAEVLIKAGADINAERAIGRGTPLEETRVHNATSVAKLLRAAGAIEV